METSINLKMRRDSEDNPLKEEKKLYKESQQDQPQLQSQAQLPPQSQPQWRTQSPTKQPSSSTSLQHPLLQKKQNPFPAKKTL